jgi:uncharacterized protein (DUF433 family)
MAIAYLDRPVYGMSQVDDVLGLTPGTARRWIDGYVRSGRIYDPVVRVRSTGRDVVTWGEFVETRFLAFYRHAGVRMIKMRPAVMALRERFGVRYPLAHVRPFVSGNRELVYDTQVAVGLDPAFRLVEEVRSGQLQWASAVENFLDVVEFGTPPGAPSEASGADDRVVVRLRPLGGQRPVVIDPLRKFGAPVVRSVPTEVLSELAEAGDDVADLAEWYELTVGEVEAAIEYEESRRTTPAA